MTRLTLLRHAKSSWDGDSPSDLERPLNERGRHDAPMMGRRVAGMLPPPDLVLVSPALRTRQTVELFLGAWGLGDAEIRIDERLYLAGIAQWRDVLADAVGADHVLACGHQPGLGDFASWLGGIPYGDVPTAAVLSLLLDGGPVARGAGRPDLRESPKGR